MTSETPNLHVSKNLNISTTKQDIEKLKTPLRLVWKCCSVVFKIGSKIFSLQWHFKCLMTFAERKAIIVLAYDYGLSIELIKTHASVFVSIR